LYEKIGVNASLSVSIVDEGNGRSLVGCTYQVSHPGGRNYTVRPVNSYEAEGRRLARFQESGHTAGQMAPPEEELNPNFPMTLDLRWPTKQESKRLRSRVARA
jgi:uncharacterized protein (DUF2126 family)